MTRIPSDSLWVLQTTLTKLRTTIPKYNYKRCVCVDEFKQFVNESYFSNNYQHVMEHTLTKFHEEPIAEKFAKRKWPFMF